MGELDDLAEAANRQRSASKTGGGIVVRRGRGGILFFVAGLVVAGTIAGTAYYAGRRSGPRSILDVVQRNIADYKAQEPMREAKLPHPGFSLSHVQTDFGDGWEITNEEETPLLVSEVTYNGEFRAAIAYIGPNSMSAHSPGTFPFSLGIGESKSLLQLGSSGMFAGSERYSYYREVLYLDVYTNRGNFRFRDGEVTNETPHFDEERAKIIDAETIARAAGADEARLHAWPGAESEAQRAQGQRQAGGGGTPNN